MLDVNQVWRTINNDHIIQYHQNHGEATIKIGAKAYVPFVQYKEQPILAIRTYTSAYTGVVNLSYYWQNGSHRCNILQDSELGAAVYCYPDVATVVEKIGLSKVGTEQCALH